MQELINAYKDYCKLKGKKTTLVKEICQKKIEDFIEYIAFDIYDYCIDMEVEEIPVIEKKIKEILIKEFSA